MCGWEPTGASLETRFQPSLGFVRRVSGDGERRPSSPTGHRTAHYSPTEPYAVSERPDAAEAPMLRRATTATADAIAPIAAR
jgi:hypothetical protein